MMQLKIDEYICQLYTYNKKSEYILRVRAMVFNATFNNISVISLYITKCAYRI